MFNIMISKEEFFNKYAPACEVVITDIGNQAIGAPDIMEEIVQTGYSEKLDEWGDLCIFENRDCHMKYLMDAARENGDIDAFIEYKDELWEEIGEKDRSNPASDMIRNTSDVCMFYDTGITVPSGHEKDASIAEIRRKLKYSGSAKNIREILENAFSGGSVRIYFNADLEDMKRSMTEKDKKWIEFNGSFALAVINQYDGSGYYDYIDLEVGTNFIRENLHVSKACRYSLEEIFGTYDDWCESDKVRFVDKKPTRTFVSRGGKVNEANGMERKYEQTFRNGKCTFGDMNMKRHRNIEYINDFPCGWKCKDCGTFWID